MKNELAGGRVEGYCNPLAKINVAEQSSFPWERTNGALGTIERAEASQKRTPATTTRRRHQGSLLRGPASRVRGSRGSSCGRRSARGHRASTGSVSSRETTLSDLFLRTSTPRMITRLSNGLWKTFLKQLNAKLLLDQHVIYLEQNAFSKFRI